MGPQAADVLLTCLADMDKDQCLGTVIKALVKAGDWRACDPMFALLNDLTEEDRKHIRVRHNEMGGIPGDQIPDVLRSNLCEVAIALAQMGDRRAREPLLSIVNDKSQLPDLRQRAAQALEGLQHVRVME